MLAAHATFDAHLTTGFNPALATALGLTGLAPVADERGAIIGMIGGLEPVLAWDAWEDRARATFGGVEASRGQGARWVARVAVMNAMRPALLKRVAEAGVDAYLTGQLRQPGLVVTARLGPGVTAVGHRRAERWGLRQLARELTAALPGLWTTVLATSRDNGGWLRPTAAASNRCILPPRLPGQPRGWSAVNRCLWLSWKRRSETQPRPAYW